MKNLLVSAVLFFVLIGGCMNSTQHRNTIVTIHEDMFFINGEPTYKGVYWNGFKIEGLLMNSRMVQGIFDDENPETAHLWKYPDTGIWDPDRNTDEFIAAMSSWREHGMLGFALNLQGGSPTGYGNREWINSAFDENGSLKKAFFSRLERILDRADELGMICMLGYFYFGQDQVLKDEAAVINAVDNATQWLLDRKYRNVIIEINNECNADAYVHPILKPGRVHELIDRVQSHEKDGISLYASTSYGGAIIPGSSVIKASDYVILHGNDVSRPGGITEMVRKTRERDGYRPMPVVFNEDDHYDFDKPFNNMIAAVQSYASWGYFDFRRDGEGFEEGFQSVPVDWGINSKRKQQFFNLLKEITEGN